MDAAEKNLAFADALIVQLLNLGAEHFVLSPGSRSTPLTLAAARCPGARTFVNLDERGAAFFAQGIAKASGKPAVLICTSGTAAANYLPAVIEASQSGTPLIVLTADRPASLYECGAPQAIDQLGLYGRSARWFLQCPAPDSLDEPSAKALAIAARAWAHAAGDDPGPVHLNCPFDEPLVPDVLPDFARVQPVELVEEAAGASEEGARRLAETASQAKRPCIVAGPLPQAQRTAVLEFAAAAALPVLADAASNLRFGEDCGARVFGHFDAWLRALPELETPDLVIHMGAQPTSKALTRYLARAEAIHVCFAQAGRWADPGALATLVLGGDPAATLAAATWKLAECRTDANWLGALESAEQIAGAEAGAFDCLERGAEIALARQLFAALPANANLFLSNSMPIREVDWFGGVRGKALNVFVNRGANGIDGIVSSALGVCAATGRPTYLLTGDLALLHDLNALAFAAAQKIPLQIIAINNDGGGIFGYLPISKSGEVFEPYFRTPHGRSITGAAAALGFECASTQSLHEFSAWIGEPATGPRLLEIPIDATRSKQIHQDYWARVDTCLHEAAARRAVG